MLCPDHPVRVTRSQSVKMTANSASVRRSKNPSSSSTPSKESSSYSENINLKLSLPSRRSRSAHVYGRDVSPNSKQRRENTSPSPIEGQDDSSYDFLNQKGFINPGSKHLSMRNSQKQFQTPDDVLNCHQSYYTATERSKDREFRLKPEPKALSAAPLKALHHLGNFGLKSDFESTIGSGLDRNPETLQSKEAFQFNKSRFHKMDLKLDMISVSQNWALLLSKYYKDIVHFLSSKLRENIEMHLNGNIVTLHCVQVELVKSLLENDVISIDLDYDLQSWLKVEVKKWKNLIDYLQNESFCLIFDEEDFSKIYVCTTAADSELILQEISKFLDQSHSDIKISPNVMEFLRLNKKFSDLHLVETAQKEIWIRSISEIQLVELKKEMKKVNCQSYLLDENQYELLCEEKKEFLSDIEKNFQVKGSPYQLRIVEDIPAIFLVNPLTSISCVVNADPENIPVDSLISVDWKTTQSTSGTPLEKYKSLEWESPARQHFHVQAFDHSTTKDEWKKYFFESLVQVFSGDIPPVTIGISFPLIFSSFQNICMSFLNALQVIWEKSMIPMQCYVILIVPEEKMKSLAEKVWKNPSIPRKSLSNYGVPIESFTVKVIRGSLADQKVDVIVNSTNCNLELKHGEISSSLLKKAGLELQSYCFENYPKGINFPNFAVTPSFNLQCQLVIHGALPMYYADTVIKRFVYDCLKYTAKYQYTSISFPALGTGLLNYPISQVVQQMNEAFKRFESHHPGTSLQEIRIVLYSDDEKLKLFCQLDNSQKDLSGTGMIQEPSNENPPKSMNWIQLMNYSCAVENLSLAISTLEEQLKQSSESSVKIPLEEFEDVFFFKDLRSVIPDIVQQLDNKKEKFYHLHLSSETKEKLGALIQEVKKTMEQSQLNIIQPVSSTILDHCLLKTRQVFPLVKCTVINNGQSVIIQSLDWNLTQEAKHFLEIWLGMKSAFSVSKDRFKKANNSTNYGTTSFSSHSETLSTQNRSLMNDNKNYIGDLEAAAASVSSSTQGPVGNESFTQSSQNNQKDICYFQTENGLLVKVYEGDILNVDVDGIVNAANGYLIHGGGIAREIIKAAGDIVNKEGQRKLDGRVLNDGEVLSTSAGNLKQYKNIIHAVGPIYSSTKNDNYCLKTIGEAVSNSLYEAEKLNFRSVALPALSSAIFGVPIDICIRGYYRGVQKFIADYTNSCLKEVHFVDKQEFCIKKIQEFFRSNFISINRESSTPSTGQSPKNLRKPSSDTKAESSSPTQKKADTMCLICLDTMKNPKTLEKCKHMFCAKCIAQSFKHKPKCPLCKIPYGIEIGNQPPGIMTTDKKIDLMPGYEKDGIFQIKYKIENPSDKRSTDREAYLPANEEGIVVLKMLQLAFERRLIFTVGESRTTGQQNVIIWNDIHHKTCISGGPSRYGYPDPAYLQRVTRELADHGITPDDVINRRIETLVITP